MSDQPPTPGTDGAAPPGVNTSSTTAPLAAALSHHRAGRWAEAERLYRQVLLAEPANSDACHWLGMLLFQAGPPALREQAVELVERSVSLAPRVPEFRNNLAAVLGTLGRTEEAIAQAREAVRLGPAFAAGWHSLGVALEHAGRPSEAVSAYDWAVALEPRVGGVPQPTNRDASARVISVFFCSCTNRLR